MDKNRKRRTGSGGNFISQLAEQSKSRAHILGIFHGSRNSHQALDLHPRQGQEFLNLLAQGIGFKAELRPLARDVHLQQYTRKSPRSAAIRSMSRARSGLSTPWINSHSGSTLRILFD